MNIWLLIAAMAVITFSVRYFFFLRILPLSIGPEFQRALSFCAPAVLTALTVPIVFFPNETLLLSPQNPYLLAALCAIFLGVFRVKTLNIIIASMLFFVAIKQLIS